MACSNSATAGRNILRNSHGIDGIRAALALFEQAIDKDPNFALAYAGLADSSLRMYGASKDGIWAQKATLGGGHGAVDLVFEGEHIARGSRELLAPDTLAGSGIVQTEGDAEFVACTLHTALQHQVDAQFTGQLGKRQIPGNCFVDSVSGRQVYFLQLKQLGTKSFSNAIGDIAQGFLVSNLFQRQDCNILPQFH